MEYIRSFIASRETERKHPKTRKYIIVINSKNETQYDDDIKAYNYKWSGREATFKQNSNDLKPVKRGSGRRGL